MHGAQTSVHQVRFREFLRVSHEVVTYTTAITLKIPNYRSAPLNLLNTTTIFLLGIYRGFSDNRNTMLFKENQAI